MKSYSLYKDSGIEWIGEIPTNWYTSKIKYTPDDSVNSFIDGDWIESKDLSDEGIRYITTGNIGEGYYKEQGKGFITEDTFEKLNCSEIFEGDLIISRLSLPVGRSCVLPMIHDKVVTSVDNVILRPKKHLNKYYLNYQFNSPKYFEYTELISRGVTLTRISRGMLGNNPIVIPPLSEQTQIVSFLDIKTQKIDELIEKTEQKIELLKEKRTSLINHCVTKGLNPNVEMKDSDVEWIGEIPSSWDVKKLKYVSDIFSSSVDRHIHEDEIQVSICHYPDVYNNEFINDEIQFNKGSCSEVEFQRYILKKGLVILTKDSETPDDIGNPCYVEIDFDNVVCGYHLTIIENNDIDVNSKFLFRFIQSDKVRCHFETESRGITRFSLGKSKIENLFVNLPSYSEQTQIVEYLDEQTQKIDSTIEKETQRIELLKEYRQSLISEVVTGKVDVRDWKE